MVDKLKIHFHRVKMVEYGFIFLTQGWHVNMNVKWTDGIDHDCRVSDIKVKLVLLDLLEVTLPNEIQDPVACPVFKCLPCFQPVDGNTTLLCKPGTENMKRKYDYINIHCML